MLLVIAHIETDYTEVDFWLSMSETIKKILQTIIDRIEYETVNVSVCKLDTLETG